MNRSGNLIILREEEIIMEMKGVTEAEKDQMNFKKVKPGDRRAFFIGLSLSVYLLFPVKYPY